MSKYEEYLEKQNALEKELRKKVKDRVGKDIFYQLVFCYIPNHELIHAYNQILAVRDDNETKE